ncbi:hypothetical protein D1007_13062 [Hordeum vulgare]|nr:hypothetical protein D1007_13062 [Hordeum vulgare]
MDNRRATHHLPFIKDVIDGSWTLNQYSEDGTPLRFQTYFNLSADTLTHLREEGLTATLVVREFLSRRIAPLQSHSRTMWPFFGPEDPKRLHMKRFPVNAINGMLHILIGETADCIPHEGCPLYKYKNGEDIVRIMPLFD